MKSPICRQQVPPSYVKDRYWGGLKHKVIAFHMGSNRKPCSGTGQPITK